MKKDFIKDYSWVNPYERFRSVVKAQARGDTAFVKSLANSCHTGRSQYARLLHMARECALIVSLDMQVTVGRWEAYKAMILPQLDADHVEYFYSTFRYFPERVERTNALVSVIEEVLIESTMRADGSDNADLMERVHEYTEAMAVFLSSEDIDPDGDNISGESTMQDVILDQERCLLTCYILGRARESVTASIGPLWLAFSSVCLSEMGLEPEVVIQAFAPDSVVSLIDDFGLELAGLDPELDVDQETESALRELWQSRTS